MRLVFMESNDAWVVKFGEQTVAIGGTTFFPDRESAVAQIAKRNLVVTEDGEIVKAGEASISTTEQPSSTPVDEPVEQDPEVRKREIAERSRKWWQENPEIVTGYRQRFNKSRRERYRTDPEFRAKVAATNKAYRERKKAEKESAQ